MKQIVTLSLIAMAMSAGRLCAAPDDTEPPPTAQRGQEERVFVQEANFEQWVFQAHGDASAARRQIESLLRLQIDDADRVCQLTEAQEQKLALAAEGDIKQFFEEVEEVREKFRAVQNDPQAFNGIWEDIQPLQQKLARGLFGETSFFSKTLRKTLTAEQMVHYRANVDRRRQYRYRATVEAALAKLEDSVPLQQHQHEALVKLLLGKMQPPHTFGQYDYYLVMHQFSKLPETELKSVLDDRQWKLLQQQFNRVRGMAPFLIQNGILAKEADEVTVDAGADEADIKK